MTHTKDEAPVQSAERGEPVAYVETKKVHGHMCCFLYRHDSTKLLPDGTQLYTTPPAAPMQEPVGRVCFEGDEVVWTDEPPESGTLLYTTLPAQPAPVAQREVIKELADQYARECVEFAKAIAEGAHSMSPIAVKSGDTRLALHTAIDAITTLPAAPVQRLEEERKAEREACLQIADDCADADMHASMAANAIRAREIT